MPDLGDADDSLVGCIDRVRYPGLVACQQRTAGPIGRSRTNRAFTPAGRRRIVAGATRCGVTDPVLPFNFAGRCRIVL